MIKDKDTYYVIGSSSKLKDSDNCFDFFDIEEILSHKDFIQKIDNRFNHFKRKKKQTICLYIDDEIIHKISELYNKYPEACKYFMNKLEELK